MGKNLHFPSLAFARWGFFAVYDGHGGALAAEHCEAELHKVGKSHGTWWG
jgi:serine/threonine protein phosphatase PrpC